MYPDLLSSLGKRNVLCACFSNPLFLYLTLPQYLLRATLYTSPCNHLLFADQSFVFHLRIYCSNIPYPLHPFCCWYCLPSKF